MKVFESKPKNFAYFLYRLISPIFDPIKFLQGIYGYLWYTKDLIAYKAMASKADLLNINLFPVLNEKTSLTFFDAQYFYYPIWAFDRILENKPKEHVDIASDYRLGGYLSNFIKTTFVDIRLISISLKNLEIRKGNILALPYKNNSISSLSCLHVIEHIGLGRYGDPIDPDGTIKACTEFKRVLKKEGLLYIATPIGKEKTCFNAHRIFNPETIINYLKPLILIEFSVITDEEKYLQFVSPKKYATQNYACGLFIFKKV